MDGAGRFGGFLGVTALSGTGGQLLVLALAIGLVLVGLYRVVASDFLALGSGAALITGGVGLGLLATNLATATELLALWPIALILYGTLVLFGDLLERKFVPRKRKRPV